MNVFLAGASGTIGLPLTRALVVAGHQVTALTRSSRGRDRLVAAGASVVVADALDAAALTAAVTTARPTCLIHQLTALPKDGPQRASQLEPTNRLRRDGTRYLLDAAIQAGARRFIVGSFAPLSPRGPAAADEDAAASAVRSMETQVLDATAHGRIDGVVLRYGLFYGPSAPSTLAMVAMVRRRWIPVVRGDAGRLPVIHLDDAVSATVAAVETAPAGAVYEVVDDQAVSLTDIIETIAEYTGAAKPLRVPAWLPRLVAPYMARMTSIRLSLSNARTKTDLGWRPAYPTMRAGVSQMLRPVG